MTQFLEGPTPLDKDGGSSNYGRRVHFPTWWSSRGRLLRESNLCLLLAFVLINPRNITIQGIYNSRKF